MRFDKIPTPTKLSRKPLAVLAAGTIAFGAAAGIELVHSLNDDAHSLIKGIGHLITAGKPTENVAAELQTAIDSVDVPTAQSVLEAQVSSTAEVDTFTSVWGVTIPLTGHNGSVSQTGSVEIMAPNTAITSRKVYELPDSTGAEPEFGVVLTVNTDSLYPAIQDPTVQSAPSGSGFLSLVGDVFTDNSPDSKDTGVATNVDNSYMEVDCTQAIAPLVQVGFQRAFYTDARQGEPDIAALTPTDQKLVTKYYEDIADESVPVKVDLVNSTGQPVPTTYKLNDASYLMTQKKIAKELGVSQSNATFNFKSPCLSTPTAVRQQIELAQSYDDHSSEPAAATANSGTDNG
jgi:hypothetical protein